MWREMSCGHHGPITLKGDGTLVAGGFPFHHTMTAENVRLGDSTLNKASGDEEPIVIKALDAVHSFRFKGGRWFYRREERGILSRLFGW